MVPKDMNRRQFLKVSAATAAVAGGGIEGILAARQAPAYAQGTKLHWVRWVDFIPESDVELKRQMPEASKALGAEVTLETINANDLQPRITAAVQSGSGADIFNFQYNWPHLYQNAVVDVSDVASALAKAEGGFYDVWAPSCQVNGKWLSVPHSIVGNAVAYRQARGSRKPAPVQYPEDLGRDPQALRRPQEEGQAVRPDARSHLRRRADLHLPMTVGIRRRRDRRSSGKKVVLNSKGAVDVGEVHAGVLEGMLRRGRAGLGRHQQQPRVPRRRALGHAERRLDLHRRQAPEGKDQGRQGRAALAGHRPRTAAGGARRRATCCS